jgi:hypothetical protein
MSEIVKKYPELINAKRAVDIYISFTLTQLSPQIIKAANEGKRLITVDGEFSQEVIVALGDKDYSVDFYNGKSIIRW